MLEIILLNITATDRVGLSADLYSVLEQFDLRILDISQSVIHRQVSQTLLLQLAADQNFAIITAQIKQRVEALDLQVVVSKVSQDDYNAWLAQQGADRYSLTLLSRELSAKQIARVTKITAEYGLNIHDIVRLSGPAPLDRAISNDTGACVELLLHGTPNNAATMRASLLELAGELNVDIAIQNDDAFRRNRRLVCFDMDSTLIKTEVIDELARHAGVGQQVAKITERAMQGELDFKQSFRQRMALLKGLDESVLKGIAATLPMMDGAETLLKNLKAYGFKTAILSGGFSYFAEHLQQKFGIDYVFANTLEIANGQLTGRAIEPIVDGQRKALLLKQLAQQQGISLEQTVAVGDGANDLAMLSVAGMGVAFRAKPLVRQSAKQSISTHGLDGILYLLGFNDNDIIR